MKKLLFLFIMLFIANVVPAQGVFDPTYLGSLNGVTLDLDANPSDRVVLETTAPKENMRYVFSLQGPGQPRVESVDDGKIMFSINVKMMRMDIGEQSGDYFYDVPVDKWYNYKSKTYTTSAWNVQYGDGGWNQCFYQLCVSVNVAPKDN